MGQIANTDEFRAAMTRLAAGVVLLSAHDAEDGPRGEDVGMTATAFMSVSLEPPLVLASVRAIPEWTSCWNGNLAGPPPC